MFHMIPDDTIDKTQTGDTTIAQMLTMQADGNDMAITHRRPCDPVALNIIRIRQPTAAKVVGHRGRRWHRVPRPGAQSRYHLTNRDNQF